MRMAVALPLMVMLMSLTGCNLDNLTNPQSTVLVDLDAVAKELGRDEAMKKELQAGEQQLRTQLEALAGDLQKQVADAQGRLNEKSTAEEKSRVDQLVLQAQQKLREEQFAAQQKAGQARADLVEAFRSEVRTVAETIARERGAEVVKIASPDVLWFDPSVDITDEVIAALEKTH